MAGNAAEYKKRLQAELGVQLHDRASRFSQTKNVESIAIIAKQIKTGQIKETSELSHVLNTAADYGLLTSLWTANDTDTDDITIYANIATTANELLQVSKRASLSIEIPSNTQTMTSQSQNHKNQPKPRQWSNRKNQKTQLPQHQREQPRGQYSGTFNRQSEPSHGQSHGGFGGQSEQHQRFVEHNQFPGFSYGTDAGERNEHTNNSYSRPDPLDSAYGRTGYDPWVVENPQNQFDDSRRTEYNNNFNSQFNSIDLNNEKRQPQGSGFGSTRPNTSRTDFPQPTKPTQKQPGQKNESFGRNLGGKSSGFNFDSEFT
jgi:hypothetical protein